MLQIAQDTEGEPLSRGTRVTLHLKEDAKDLADDKKLGDLIKQYSEFIQFPIRLWQSSTKSNQVSQAMGNPSEILGCLRSAEGKFCQACNPSRSLLRHK